MYYQAHVATTFYSIANAADIATALAGGTTVPIGTSVQSVGDPPVQQLGFTQVLYNGQQGWISSGDLVQVMNPNLKIGIGLLALYGIWAFLIRRR